MASPQTGGYLSQQKAQCIPEPGPREGRRTEGTRKEDFGLLPYSGPHTGIREAIPAGLYAGQFFEHVGFTILDEWYIVGEFHGKEEESTQGRLGDIRGRPNKEDLRKVKQDAQLLVSKMKG